MPANFGNTPRDNVGIPTSSVYVPGTSNSDLTTLQGGPSSTDGNSQKSAPVMIYGADGNILTLGAKTDSTWDGSSSGASAIAILRKIGTNQAGAYNVQFQSPQSVNSGYTELTGSANALNGYLLNWTDISSYAWISVYIYGTYSGTISFLQSPDNGTHSGALSMYLGQNGLNPNQEATTTTGTSQLWAGPRISRYFAVQMTSYSSGTANVIVGLFTIPPALILNGTNALQSGTWTVSTTGPSSNAAQAANTASNTVVKGSAGYLWSAVVTTLGTAQLDIYDNASTNSGRILLAIPASAVVGSIYSFPGGARASNGITSNGVSNCPAVTFYYS